MGSTVFVRTRGLRELPCAQSYLFLSGAGDGQRECGLDRASVWVSKAVAAMVEVAVVAEREQIVWGGGLGTARKEGARPCYRSRVSGR